MLSTFFSFNGVQLLQLTVQASDVNIMCWGKLRVLSDIVSFSYSRVVNRFASCVGAEWYAHLIDPLLAGTRNQGIYRFPLSQLNPVCNILNCSLTDFVLPNLTLERTFSELEVVFQMCVLQQAHQYPCDEDAVCGMKPIQKLCQDSLQSICPSPDYGLWTVPSQALPSDLTIPHADVFCAGCCLFLFFDFFGVCVPTAVTNWSIFLMLPLAKSQIHGLHFQSVVGDIWDCLLCLYGDLGYLIWKFIWFV